MTLAIFGERQSGQDVRSANGRKAPVFSFKGETAVILLCLFFIYPTCVFTKCMLKF